MRAGAASPSPMNHASPTGYVLRTARTISLSICQLVAFGGTLAPGFRFGLKDPPPPFPSSLVVLLVPP